ncbi:MAG: WD40/YVTN/BNR-like repeat-containing protein [Gemmatimonadaceae bacterium]
MARSTLRTVLRFAIASAFVLATAAALTAQQPAKGARPAPAAAAAPAPNPAELLKRMPWRSVGPTNNAGRISEIVGVPGDPLTYYVAGANGGIIKTTNGGNTFTSIFDKTDAGSIGAIAIAPSDKNVVYVGTGEGNPRNNASVGVGMYKSIDGGDHWTHIGLEKSDKVARLIVDSKNPDIVYACVLGREWGANEDRGVYKTTDGGVNWKKILYVDPQTSCSDISADPTNSNIVYAGMYTYRRWAWHLESGAGNTAVWKSVNGGATWERLSGPDKYLGLPRKAMDRIGIAVAPSDPNIVYVISETKDEGQLWRTDDAGQSWRTVNSDRNISFRPFYYSDIRVDPKNPNRVFALSGGLYFSEDGGLNFRTIARGVHGDHQAMWIDPVDPRTILSGSDGGWQMSRDGGKDFDVVNTFPFTQFYHLNYDMQVPYRVCGGLQDNGNWCGPSNSLSGQGIRTADWYTVSGGDGFFTVPVMDKPWLVFSNSQGGMLNITDTRSGAQKTIYPYPNRVGSVGDAMIGHKYRFNWNSPIALSWQNPGVAYFGGNVVFKSTNYGLKWDVISPDLTTNDPKKQQSSGGEIVTDNTAAEFHSTLLSIAPSPLDSNVIWTSSDDGMAYVTRDGGTSWTSTFANVQGLKPNAWLATIEASHFDVGTAYLTADHHQDDDYTPYVYMTTDFGKTWKSIRGDLPDKAWWTHVIREDPRNRNLLYVGTEAGIWASWDRGTHWVSLRADLPVTPVRDLQIHPRDNDLIVATHGRGLYIMDDITALQELDAAGRGAENAMLFDIRPSVRWNMWNKDGNLGQRPWAGENPPNGAIISYFLKAQPAGAVNVEIADASGRVVRRFNRVMDEAGVSRITWDGRYEAAPGGFGGRGGGGGGGAAAGQATDTSLAALRARRRAATTADAGPGGGGGFFGGGGGVAALPGTYQVSLVVGGKKYTKPVTLRNDPRVEMTPAQVTAQYEAGVQLQALGQRVTRVVASTDDLITQLSNTQATLRRNARDNGAVLAEIEGTIKDLRHFRDSVLARPLAGLGYRQYPRLREEVQTVTGMVTRPQWPITEGEKLRSGELRVEADGAQARLDGIITNRVGKINEMLKGTQHVITPAVRVQP